MSFGWSAGDIAAAIKLIYKLIQALDSCDGAAHDYREAVGFLGDLKRTLNPLQAFAAWNAYPSYAIDIEQQVLLIREPVETFLEAVAKFEPCLGQKAPIGHHRHVFRKLQWHVSVSKKALTLKKKIESLFYTIHSLQSIRRELNDNRRDIVFTTKTQLPQHLQTVFNDTLRPDLLSLLRENLLPLNEKLLANVKNSQDEHHKKLTERLVERYDGMSADILWIKQHIDKPCHIQEQINSALSRANSARKDERSAKCSAIGPVKEEPAKDEETLQNIYYLVFLYLGYFLKNLFLALSRLVEPSRALMPKLLAKYNISFLDAIGRAPRVLPYEIIQSLDILKAFVKQEFRSLPGSSWVERGDYQLLSSLGDQPLTTYNWTKLLLPGTTVTMSMVVSHASEISRNQFLSQCPQAKCRGEIERSETSRWSTCSICRKEFFLYEDNKDQNLFLKENEDTSDNISEFGPRPAIASQSQSGEEPLGQERTTSSPTSDVLRNRRSRIEEEIAFFKRFTLSAAASLKRREDYGYRLHCEFEFVDCQSMFHPSELESWISHSASHFHGVEPPPKTCCIFCDRVFENYEHPSRSWRKRMLHIADHFRSGYRQDNTRPDFLIIEYMWKERLMSCEDYKWAIEGTERPNLDGLVDLGYKPPEIEWKEERRRVERHDLEKEERQRRREKERRRVERHDLEKEERQRRREEKSKTHGKGRVK